MRQKERERERERERDSDREYVSMCEFALYIIWKSNLLT